MVKSWTEDAQELIPVAHYDNSVYPTVTGTNAKNLVYNTNPEQVSRATGKKAASVDLTFAHVPADGNGTYFIDKVVYIASLGKAMAQGADYTNLMFAISESGNGTLTNTAYKSASVDVYVGNTYKGTLNLDTMSSVTVSDLTAIPINTGTPVEITFRCYFDGSLINATDNTKTYVNSAALATNNADITIGIAITATP